ncbi:MAG: Asp-tRNA(Asn)/Glu-tRNA(Gln) amidotransferase GatCAB subunit B, partial [Erysipelothrix sp.]|nr:Asp-tRNA(Asn)/Glu-tRNA(Gln) amidotransferase GatCAB subunit B [Erysipelothrix sp.]
MKRDVVIGIEIHCELKSKAKMFSDAPITFNAEVNSFANEIDVGYPGTLPSLNQEAVRLSLMACLITDCEIDRLM